MSAIDNAILAGHAASIRLHARGNYRMGALECLVIVQARLPGSRLDGRLLYVGEQHVATATGDDSAVLVRYATVFDGFRHCTPAGCDTSVTKVESHKDPVGRVLKAIDERQAARAKSLPVPEGDPGRDPEEVCCDA